MNFRLIDFFLLTGGDKCHGSDESVEYFKRRRIMFLPASRCKESFSPGIAPPRSRESLDKPKVLIRADYCTFWLIPHARVFFPRVKHEMKFFLISSVSGGLECLGASFFSAISISTSGQRNKRRLETNFAKSVNCCSLDSSLVFLFFSLWNKGVFMPSPRNFIGV